MSKAYIITAVDYNENTDGKAKTHGVYFDLDLAQKALEAEIEDYKALHPTYTEGKLAVTDEDGEGREWNIEEVEVVLPLTNIQVCQLNLLAQQIANGEEGFAAVEDSLFDEERNYLMETLKNTYHIDLTKEEK